MIQKTIKRVLDLPEWKIGLGIFLVALLLRIVYVVAAYYVDPPWWFGDYSPGGNIFYPAAGDDVGYITLAKKIAENGKILYTSIDHGYNNFVGPGLPWLLSLIYLVFGENWLVIYIITAIVSSMIPYFTYKTSTLIFDKKTSILAGVWSLFYFYYFWYASSGGKDIWNAFFYIFCLYSLIYLFYKKKFRYTKFIIFIFVFVYALHWDERFLLFAPFVAFFIFYFEINKVTRFRLLKSSLFVGLTIILLIPWTIRNYHQHGKIVLISIRSQAITDKLFGYEPIPLMVSDIYDVYGTFYIKEQQIDSVIAGQIKVTDGGHVISERQRRFMEDGNLPVAFSNFEAYWSRFKRMFRPVQLRDEWVRTGYEFNPISFRQNIISLVFYGPMLLFSFFGFYYLYKKSKTLFWTFVLPIIIYTLVHVLMVQFAGARYRLIFDSTIILIGCFGATSIYQSIKPRIKKGSQTAQINN